MSGDPLAIVDYRRALEALRSGVPNRDAVRVLGCSQREIEQRFSEQLDAVEAGVREERQAPGLLIAGRFGSGKSHLIEYLEHLALSKNFVCSRVVISKETPLYDPAKVYLAAIATAVVPGLSGQAIHEIALRLMPNAPAYAAFYKWANHQESGISALFPATLLLHERHNDPEMVEEIRTFWSGEKMPVSRARQGLQQIGSGAAYVLKAVPARELALQRFSFATRLILAAGYKGWLLLIDEVELVGRYSLLQRGRSYAELARWMGKIEAQQYPGLTAVAAITDDYALAVLQEKGDRDYVGPKLHSRGTDEDVMLAGRAEAGMRLIEREAATLLPPDDATLDQTYQLLKAIYGKAYGWQPPEVAPAERAMTRAMRSYVRRWINEWDLKRLYPGRAVSIVEDEQRPTYQEDQDLQQASDPPQREDSLDEWERDDGRPLP